MFSRSTADAARVASMAAVLVIHATQPSCDQVLRMHTVFSVDTLAMALNQAARFCVPMFIVLSGYALMAREQALAQKKGCALTLVTAWQFYKDRLSKIVLPFTLWSLIYFLWSAPWQAGLGTALDWLLRDQPLRYLSGQAQYHLYFIPIIVQCYLLFPVLMRLPSPWWTALFFCVTLILTYPSQELFAAIGIQALHIPAWCSPVFLAWFSLGMRLASVSHATPKASPKASRRWLALAIFVLAMFGVIGEFWHNSFRFDSVDEICHFNRWSVLVLVAAAVWNLAVWNQTIACWLEPPRTKKALQWLAGVSFAVYFLHPLILNALMQAGLQNPFLKLALLIGLSLLAVAGLERLLQKTPRIAQALGW